MHITHPLPLFIQRQVHSLDVKWPSSQKLHWVPGRYGWSFDQPAVGNPPEPCTVIAGTQHLGMAPVSWLSYSLSLLSFPNDGTVSVKETHLHTPHTLHTVKATHTAIIKHPDKVETDFILETATDSDSLHKK